MIKKYQFFKESNNISNEFAKRLEIELTNVSESKWTEIWKSIPDDIMTNIKLVGTFGAGITGFFPIVDGLVRNMGLNSNVSEQSIVYITIASCMFIVMEENKNNDIKNSIKTLIEKLSKEEMELFPKVIECIRSLKTLFTEVISNIGKTLVSMIDMLSYTAYLILILNVINYLIGKYHFTLDNLPGNILSIIFGIGTGVIKTYLTDVVKKIKS